ncbi:MULTISPECIES: NifB/NifX family molybdenum-iron cluster-binding protein [Desulfococcus]|jgi:predicted Fe-Mo cluster-binding NifX family protein|uniref:Dinitrogenase iron-molybdenum cofactor biosynthesis protein n=1 Tax=Desulfococcus multivorans DSM 2059 TaxID=1121405 RepID=S7UTY4_DESML|nr:NifB/NifX family molybdenum-iron cluster-binding protein [Desulfococcus multivorans]AOY59783.1 uncharacterized protein Dmul_30130 [Desulfococcus multivorans]AQV01953.1 hypothetical protein B2D07_15100 [Desulfococcus multivorans]EPR35783.1 Dinitrogenase iron-molybdenum cofactor biosynthesis protein [Desulfococcus multivorans DSM 2059]SJZ33168.1 Predicted Fe-Mo cluster-binding protein, NifX family [Desulfococcus multivorans DSM 2059]
MIRKSLATAILVLTVLGVCVTATAENRAILAVAADGAAATAQVGTTAARSPYFLLFDRNGELLEAVKNPYVAEHRNAGPKVVDFLSARGIHTIVAGEFGAKMIAAMQQNDMAFHTATGPAADAVMLMKKK